MTPYEVERIAPNLNLFLWRPILSDPPIYSMADLKRWVTLTDVLDAHEGLDLKAAMSERNQDK